MLTRNQITSNTTGRSYKIKSQINYKTTSVVYLIECKKCRIWYVGQTSNTLQERIRGHFYDIKQGNQFKSVSRHFMGNNHTIRDVSIIGITITTNHINNRLRTEEAWIKTLQTKEPQGLNRTQ